MIFVRNNLVNKKELPERIIGNFKSMMYLSLAVHLSLTVTHNGTGTMSNRYESNVRDKSFTVASRMMNYVKKQNGIVLNHKLLG